MGEVYRALDSVLQRKVAVKVLSERHAHEEEVRKRFRREALAAARLSGTPHVITIFDVGEHRGRPYIVMEYLDGGSVHQRLRDQGRIPPGQALEWLAQAGVALDRAHAQGIVHRDVKPANLLLDGEGKVVVSDFGIASTTGVDTLTLPGTVLGTVGYISPEQARGESATAASDRYSLGVVAFELLTGRRPFEGDTAATEAFAHAHAPVPSAEKLHPELPSGVDEVLGRALAKEPAERPETCAKLVADLRDAFRGVAATRVSAGGPVSPAATRRVPAVPPSAPAGRTRRTLTLGAVALLLAGVVVAALLGAVLDSDSPERGARTAPTTTRQPQATARVDGASLNHAAFALMQDGEYGRARPLLEKAVAALRGSGTRPEAFAYYNLAYTRFALGQCRGVLPLLERSEAIQGQRWEIDQLYADVAESCFGGGDKEEGEGGKGEGKGGEGKGRGRG